uniref:Uncharacterized protein n=1 Tax=Arundo donax TaxID=35708 RepID=A0A0A8YE87_ARUDO
MLEAFILILLKLWHSFSILFTMYSYNQEMFIISGNILSVKDY